MRLAFVAQPFDRLDPPVQGGSLAIWIYQVARRCAQQGHTVFVIANQGQRFASTRTEYEDVTYIYTATGPNGLLNRAGEGVSRLRRLAGQKDRVPTFAAGWRDAGYAFEAARFLRQHECEAVLVMNYSQVVPVIRRVHRSCRIFLYMQCEWLTQLDRETMRQRLEIADVVGGCSEYIARKIAADFPEHARKCVTLNNAASPVVGSEASQRDGRRVLFVGRVSPEKGLHTLIEAFHLVLREFPDATLDILGGVGSVPLDFLVGLSDEPKVAALRRFYEDTEDGGKDPYLRYLERAAGPELGKRIVFHGHVDHDRTTAAYARASVLTNPSLSESFGMSLVEAMMNGVPVVATRTGGMQYIVEQGMTGLLVEAEDPEALARALCDVLRDQAKARRMGEAGRRRALDRFSWDRTAETLLAHCASVVGQQGR